MGSLYKIQLLNRGKPYLIFDLGFHNGDTSIYYLQHGCKVIGVECNPYLNQKNLETYNLYIPHNLILENYAISNLDNLKIPFYLSTCKLWSSINKEIAERLEKSTEILVETITLKTLIEKHRCPDYCKIDIEGSDVLAVRSLLEYNEKPKIISVEAECLGNNKKSDVDMLYELNRVGYNKFFIIDQRCHSDFRFDFFTNYKLYNYKEAKLQLDNLKKEDFEYGVWADIYATY